MMNSLFTSREVVTPEMAKAWLDLTKESGAFSNRSITDKNVDLYVKDMKEGKWLENGETIKLSPEGYVVDGQHRLSAVAKSGVPQTFLVVRGVSPDVICTVDVGRKRSMDDIIKMSDSRGWKRGVGAVVSRSLALRSRSTFDYHCPSSLGSSQSNQLEEYYAHKALYLKSVDFGKTISSASTGDLYAVEVSAIYAHLILDLNHSEESVERFFILLSHAPRGDKKNKFEKTLTQLKDHEKCRGKVRTTWIKRCFNAYIRGNRTMPSTPKQDHDDWFIGPKDSVKNVSVEAGSHKELKTETV